MNAMEIISAARDQIAALTSLPVDTVSRFKREGDGWVVEIELVEMRRIPNSSDVLATYQIQLDSDGSLLSYQRTQRYYRGQVKE
ncbi:gas vesicle protein [Oscillochloris sp. ZM17-4]|uniref:gas vesicle protein GvpO n=1 Tax=Oscillochloris sp. ZM17-4 TaxID=2866714 RepID=UPI001C72B702|nr:gas vesicle protein [Oscillochloris sp. ZM17-4]MBX0331529.1 gas vesicle protein [Oscillochloris sp. ZM17-4]